MLKARIDDVRASMQNEQYAAIAKLIEKKLQEIRNREKELGDRRMKANFGTSATVELVSDGQEGSLPEPLRDVQRLTEELDKLRKELQNLQDRRDGLGRQLEKCHDNRRTCSRDEWRQWPHRRVGLGFKSG